MDKNRIIPGRKVQFDPFETVCGYGVEEIRGPVTGVIVAVYQKHEWFSVAYGNNQRTSFLFSDIGERVKFIG